MPTLRQYFNYLPPELQAHILRYQNPANSRYGQGFTNNQHARAQELLRLQRPNGWMYGGIDGELTMEHLQHMQHWLAGLQSKNSRRHRVKKTKVVIHRGKRGAPYTLHYKVNPITRRREYFKRYVRV